MVEAEAQCQVIKAEAESPVSGWISVFIKFESGSSAPAADLPLANDPCYHAGSTRALYTGETV